MNGTIFTIGVIMIVAGAWWVYPPAGLIAAGLALSSAAVAMGYANVIEDITSDPRSPKR